MVYNINWFIFASEMTFMNMETESKLTPERSLALINETLEGNRRAVLAGSGKFFLLWGAVLFVFSLAVWLPWSRTGNPVWNLLWLGMPAVGYPAAAALARRSVVPQSFITRLLGAVWGVFAFFAFSVSGLASVFPIPLTMVIILLLGLAESVSGVILKSWPFIVAGAVVGLGGACAAGALSTAADQVLVFTGAAVVLVLTGLAIKLRK